MSFRPLRSFEFRSARNIHPDHERILKALSEPVVRWKRALDFPTSTRNFKVARWIKTEERASFDDIVPPLLVKEETVQEVANKKDSLEPMDQSTAEPAVESILLSAEPESDILKVGQDESIIEPMDKSYDDSMDDSLAKPLQDSISGHMDDSNTKLLNNEPEDKSTADHLDGSIIEPKEGLKAELMDESTPGNIMDVLVDESKDSSTSALRNEFVASSAVELMDESMDVPVVGRMEKSITGYAVEPMHEAAAKVVIEPVKKSYDGPADSLVKESVTVFQVEPMDESGEAIQKASEFNAGSTSQSSRLEAESMVGFSDDSKAEPMVESASELVLESASVSETMEESAVEQAIEVHVESAFESTIKFADKPVAEGSVEFITEPIAKSVGEFMNPVIKPAAEPVEIRRDSSISKNTTSTKSLIEEHSIASNSNASDISSNIAQTKASESMSLTQDSSPSSIVEQASDSLPNLKHDSVTSEQTKLTTIQPFSESSHSISENATIDSLEVKPTEKSIQSDPHDGSSSDGGFSAKSPPSKSAPVNMPPSSSDF